MSLSEGQINQGIKKQYDFKTTVNTYDVGENSLIRPSVLMKLQQEAGERQLAEGNLGYQRLIEEKLAFITVQTKSVYKRLPRVLENITVRTWHRNNKGVRFFRCYQVFDEAGDKIVDSITSFVLVDFDTHKVLRPNVFEKFGLYSQPDKNCDCPEPEKIILPENMTVSSANRTIFWSDIDWNGHVNNSVYADIMCDYVYRYYNDKQLKGFTLSYLNEAVKGESLVLSTRLEEADGFEAAYISGKIKLPDSPSAGITSENDLKELKPCFDAKVILENL